MATTREESQMLSSGSIQNDFHHQGHRVHIDAAHQDGHEGKTDGRKRPVQEIRIRAWF
jgi:hypothetical protein